MDGLGRGGVWGGILGVGGLERDKGEENGRNERE